MSSMMVITIGQVFNVIVYSVVSLVIGGLTFWFTENFCPEMPYTVCLFLEGAAIPFIVRYTNIYSTEDFASNSTLVGYIILYMILPLLIFGEAMNLNWHHVTSGLYQSLWLAGPGVVIGTLLMATATIFIIPTWTFPTALLFGSIISATDPVAVLALLKSTKVSHQLSTVIGVESLLNDGSAIVLYTLFTQIVSGIVPTAITIFTFFIYNVIFSPALGASIGFMSNKLMRFLDNGLRKVDITVQIFITFITAYVSFILSAYLGLSGVLSAASAGLMIARFAPPFMIYHHSMREAWHIFEWVCNTLIFFFGGLVAAYRSVTTFQSKDLYLVLVMYVLMMVIRGVMILVLYPIISRGKLQVTVNDSVFMVWGGLRGALGIALAIQVQGTVSTSNSTVSAEVGSQLFIMVVGCATLTLLVNAPTAKYLLRYLKLTEESRVSEEDRKVIDDLMQMRFASHIRATLLDEDDDNNFQLKYNCDIIDVQDYCSLIKPLTDTTTKRSVLSLSGEDVRNSLLSLSRRFENNSIDSDELSDNVMTYLRKQFYESLRSYYINIIKEGKIDRASYASQALLNSVDVALDFIHEDLCDWDFILNKLNIPPVQIYITKLVDKICLYFKVPSRLHAWLIVRKRRRHIYIVTNYLDAHRQVSKSIPTFLGGSELDEDLLPEELKLKNESFYMIQKASEFFDLKYDKQTQSRFYAQRAAKVLLNKQAAFLEKMIQEGAMSQIAAKSILATIEEDQHKLLKERALLNKDYEERNISFVSSGGNIRAKERSFFDMFIPNHSIISKFRSAVEVESGSSVNSVLHSDDINNSSDLGRSLRSHDFFENTGESNLEMRTSSFGAHSQSHDEYIQRSSFDSGTASKKGKSRSHSTKQSAGHLDDESKDNQEPIDE